MINYKKWADNIGLVTVILALIFIVPGWFIGPQKHDLVVAYGFVGLLSLQCLLLRYAAR